MAEFNSRKIMEKIKEAESELIRLDTQEKTIMDALKKDFNFSSVKEAEAFLTKEDIALTALEETQSDRERVIMQMLKENNISLDEAV